MGNFGQLPPVGDRPLFASPGNNPLSIHGHHIYQIFDTVVFPQQVIRQNGTDGKAESFRELLLHLRNATVTHNDWKMLLECDPNKVDNHADFAKAIYLYYDKASVDQYNIQKLQELGTPIARINAIHSGAIAAAANGLESVVFLAPGSRVMLTANLWPEVGPCNGAAGVVYQLLYTKNQQPPTVPIAVLVDFDSPFLHFCPNSIPIPPITIK